MPLSLLLLLLSLSLTSAAPPASNLTLSGAAHFLNSSISLTATSPNCSDTSAGAAYYLHPIRFYDPESNTTASFSSLFSFQILPSSLSCPFGDGFTFVIGSKIEAPETRILINGYMGLQEPDPGDPFFAIEFDTSFDPNLGDFSPNHVGIDLNSIVSITAIDYPNLRSGRRLTAWIEYLNSEKSIRVWIGNSRSEKPKTPLLKARIDLSHRFEEFVHVGFSASNSRGSALHLIDTWQFKTSGLHSSVQSMDTIGKGDCFMCPQEGQNSLLSELALALGALAAFIICICSIVCIVILCMMRKKKSKKIKKLKNDFRAPKRLSLSEIRSATKNFNKKKIIGQGGTATVYLGQIPTVGSVAIKRFTRVMNQISPFRNEFSTEFATMVGLLKHKNLVQLIGWCCEGNELVLVYEYVSNGSLDKVVHNNNLQISDFLTWEKRLNIIFGVGSALIYLHEECERQVIHRDVKTCNIMLDEEFNPKLGDFGLAEVYNHSSVLRDATLPAGTVGYLAPEYVYTGVPSVYTDVYSFGVVALEVVSGMTPVVEKGVMLTDRMWEMWERGDLISAVDCRMKGRFRRCEAERVLTVGMSCVHPNCEERPTVKGAVRMMKGEVAVAVLPRRKPTVRIQSVGLPEGSVEIMSREGEEAVGDEAGWLTPRTHFSRN